MLVITRPNTVRRLPRTTMGRKWPRSWMGPVNMPAMPMKTWVLPLHAIAEGDGDEGVCVS